MLPFLPLPFPRNVETALTRQPQKKLNGHSMDSITMRGGRSPLFLTGSSSQRLPSTCFLSKGKKNGVGDAGSACRPTVAILGSGDFSKCMTLRLLRCGFHVVLGSRHPKLAAQLFPHVVDVTHHEDALAKASIIFLAIRREHYSVLWDLKHLLEGSYQHKDMLRFHIHIHTSGSGPRRHRESVENFLTGCSTSQCV